MPVSPPVSEVPRRLFSPIAPGYDRPALLLSLLQYRRWHRFLLSRLPLPSPQPATRLLTSNLQPPTSSITILDMATGTGAPADPARAEALEVRAEPIAFRVLDMASGTGALAFDLLQRDGLEVVAADITRPMLRQAQRRAAAGDRLALCECTAEAPPFADASFDALVFAYLLRYVSDVPATLRGLARLLRPGGTMASLDFAVPAGVWHPLWRLYTDAVLPLAGALFSPHWRRVGAFLGPSIRDFYRRWPEPHLLQAWREAGFPDVRARRLSLGGALVIWGTKPT